MNNYFRYKNQPCPVCQQSFQPDDDIVVCPVCGTPHHRDCYKQNGECGNFEKHNEGFRWAPEKAEEPIETAQNKNPPVSDSNIQDEDMPPFFKNVSNQFSLFPKEMEDGISTDEVAEFVGLSAPKYVQNFFYVKSHKRTFNWAAFFFAPYWFFYRKMHKLGAIFLALFLVINIGFNFLPPVQKLYEDMEEWSTKYETATFEDYSQEELMEYAEESMGVYTNNVAGTALMFAQSGLAIALNIFIGFKANKWYYDHTITNIRKIKAEEPDPQKQRLLLFKSGGASMGAAFLAVLANNIVVMAAEMLLTFIK